MNNNYKTYKSKIDGIFLNYAKIGSGKPLVLIHGWTNNWEGWIPIVSYLQKNYTLYVVDLPGFGDSGDLENYNIPKAAEYIALFIKTLDIATVGLLGFSMGTFVAAQTALSYPQLVNSVILIGPPLKQGTNFTGNRPLQTTLRSFDKFRLTQRFLKKIIESKNFTYSVAKYMNMYKFDKSLVDKYGMVGKKKLRIDAFIDMGLSFSSTNLAGIIKNLNIPTLLILGREDKVAPPHYAKAVINNNLKLSIIPFAGHMTFWEKPQQVAESIKTFTTEN
ncbi:alpha/beta hydrolase [Candidatus Gottesmanbacteria bacterium]|nr:alpha/beta hydrolase [Candidatus Gottesmanbacteria bacterium]